LGFPTGISGQELAAVLLAVLTITVATYGLIDLVFVQRVPDFMINLTGSEEVPPVRTNAKYTAEISAFNIVSNSILYTINVSATSYRSFCAGSFLSEEWIDNK
jgi:hypothetical protein